MLLTELFKGGGPDVFLILCGFVVFTTGHFMFSLALFFVHVFICFFFSSFSIVITSHVEERAGLCASVLLVHLFVYFACIDFSPFSLTLGVMGWLRLVIVALPGLFY